MERYLIQGVDIGQATHPPMPQPQALLLHSPTVLTALMTITGEDIEAQRAESTWGKNPQPSLF